MVIDNKKIALIAILLFAVVAGALTLRVLVHAPFWIPGDIFSYLGWTQSIVDAHHINFLSPGNGPILYSYFPGLFILLASGSILTGLSVPVVAVVANIVYVMLLAVGFAAVAWSVFRDARSMILAAIIGSSFGGSYGGISTPNVVFPFLATPNISLLFFLGAVILFVEALRRMPVILWRQHALAAFLSTAAILIHPQSGLFRGSVLSLACAAFIIFARRNDRFSFAKLAMFYALPWLFVLAINFQTLPLIFQVGVGVAVNNSLGIAATTAPTRFTTNYGPFFTFLALLGLAIAVARQWRYRFASQLQFVIILSAITIASTFVDLLGVYFFGGRFLGELLLPYTLLATYALRTLLDLRLIPRALSLSIVMGTLLLSVVSFVSVISRSDFDFDWPSVRALEWANRNIQNAKVMADPYMLYMFFDMAHIRPAYYDIRSLHGIDHNIGIQTVLVDRNPEAAYRYAKKNTIDYVIIDTYFDPLWVGLASGNFQNQQRFLQVFSIRHSHTTGEIKIYRVL